MNSLADVGELTDRSLGPQNYSHTDHGTAHSGVALETICSPECPAEGECCRGCPPSSASPGPPAHPSLPTMGVTTLDGVEVCQDGEEFCLTSEGGMDVLGAQDSLIGEMSLQNNKERLPFQIFPDPVEVSLSPDGSPNCLQLFSLSEKERLPSIMVEPTDVSEVESGELRWPPEHMDFCSEEDEDLFLEQCIPPANIADWGEEDEETSVIINHQQNTSLIDIYSDALRDETPILPPSSARALD
ncbi:hypothetical protein UPYG_G00201570 [Umbra pygmaea]|uniref:LBH domain-containing protein n=1 Tax=Umbra pygmaea TaxID=75934 RepID=A0ABD0X0H5_UMBPY